MAISGPISVRISSGISIGISGAALSGSYEYLEDNSGYVTLEDGSGGVLLEAQ